MTFVLSVHLLFFESILHILLNYIVLHFCSIFSLNFSEKRQKITHIPFLHAVICMHFCIKMALWRFLNNAMPTTAPTMNDKCFFWIGL